MSSNSTIISCLEHSLKTVYCFYYVIIIPYRHVINCRVLVAERVQTRVRLTGNRETDAAESQREKVRNRPGR